MEKQKDTLYIPQGIKKEREYFNGIGLKEIKIIAVSFVIAAGIAAVMYVLTKIQVIAFFIALFIPSGTYMGVIKDDSNVSAIDLIRFYVKDSRTQKHYPYVAKAEL
ncbi:hypothetical protein [[Clostridium] polysaccharolyticum]|uniref:PrgI family protein n=1 Tax=[Clostridium] polysaccharolyticum TaxID=29364 RepID=A0A1H9Y9S5_9FIRM|nr:hypothetical protein [[Clostridium] polysaccharolyticum]SES65176.1 hypothetical protein SAMN04487772_101214 [[Clostridium] polysaccharolyticum]